MTASYGPLAAWYDALTRDVDYAAFADFYERQFELAGGEMRTLLDLCCGTGTLTCLLAERGYEMIAADASYDMLMQAREKAAALPSDCVPPLLLCQSAEELDLYGTVDAAVCSLDGFDYLQPEDLPEVLHRLHLFIRPGGLLIFDIRTPESFEALDGEVFLDETDDVLCLWRAELTDGVMRFGMDLFEREGDLWSRESEEHVEYVHTPELLTALLQQQGFGEIRTTSEGPQGDQGRLFFIAARI